MAWELPLSPDGIIRDLPDGGSIVLRPIRATDQAALLSAFERMSPRSRYLRFFRETPTLSPQLLEYFTDIDHVAHLAWVAGDPSRVDPDTGDALGVGVARLIGLADQEGTAEAAIVVTDDYQGRGIGSLLFRLLVHTARVEGFEQLVAYVRVENEPMRRLAREAGGVSRFELGEPGVVAYQIPLPDVDDTTDEDGAVAEGALYDLLRLAARGAAEAREPGTGSADPPPAHPAP